MPAAATDETIPLASTARRISPRQERLPHGLDHRYGRRMQTISGSTTTGRCPAWATGVFRARSAISAATPSCCCSSSALAGGVLELRRRAPARPADAGGIHTLPAARDQPAHGRLGYQSEAQATLAVSYNSMDSYTASLHER